MEGKGMERYRYAIVGNSAAAINACECIRDGDGKGSMVLLAEERYRCYSRPLISYLLAGKIGPSALFYRSKDFYRRMGVDFRCGERVVSVFPEEHELLTAAGRRLRWEKLLLATGSRPFVPGVEGLPESGYFTFTSWDDARELMKWVRPGKRALVMGAGLIGMKASEALQARGVRVTVVEKMERILPATLDEYASGMVAERCVAHGLELLTGRSVLSVEPEKGMGGKAFLDDGSELAYDLLVVAVGMRPRSELAVEAGLRCSGDAVLVDEHLRTSHPSIFAAGDLAAAHDLLSGRPAVNALWPLAALQGKFAGWNMAGRKVAYPGGNPMNSVELFGMPVLSAGVVDPPDGSYRVLARKTDGGYRKVVLKDDRLVGLLLAGDIEGAGLLTALLREGVSVRGFLTYLVEPGFGFSHLPPRWRKERMREGCRGWGPGAPQACWEVPQKC